MAVTDNARYVYQWFVDRGYSPTIAAGFAGNMQTEAYDDIDPTAISGDGFKGVIQWDEKRYNDLVSFSNDNGLDISDINTQLAFIDWELHHTESNAAQSIVDSNLDTAEDAASAIDEYYERSTGSSRTERMANAQAIYDDMYDGGDYNNYAIGSTEYDSSGASDTDVNTMEQDAIANLPEDTQGLDQAMLVPVGLIFKKARELGVEPILTAGKEWGVHAPNSYHHSGLGADIAWDGLQWGDPRLDELADYAKSLGFSEVLHTLEEDPNATGPHLHIGGPDLSKAVEGILGKKGTPSHDVALFGTDMQKNRMAPDAYAQAEQMYQSFLNQQRNPQTPPSPSLFEGIWHDFKRSGNFLYNFVDALYADLFQSDNDIYGKQRITDADKEYVKAAMGKGNEAEAQWIIDNAHDPHQLYYYLQQKMDDMQEDQKYAAYYNKIGLHNIGSVIGMLIDPVNLLPELKVAQGARAVSRLGGVVRNVEKIDRIASSTAANAVARVTRPSGIGKIADSAINMAAMSGLQQHIENNRNSTDDSIAGAALMGGIAGGVLRTLGMGAGKLFSKQKEASVMNLAKTADKVETKAIQEAMDLDTRIELFTKSKEVVQQSHDTEYFTSKTFGKSTQMMAKRDDVFAMSLEDAKKLGDSIGVSISNNAKGFYVPFGDYTVIIKDNIKNRKQLEGVLAHEIGVHQGLEKMLGTEQYKNLMSFVAEQAKEPSTPYAQAARMAKSSDPEEILGYAIENNLLKKRTQNPIASVIRQGLKNIGVGSKVHYTNKQIMDLVQKALQAKKIRDSGIIVNDDASVISNGVHFSKDNMIAPESLLDYEDMANAQNEAISSDSKVGRVIDRISQAMDYGAFTKTPFGIFFHSPSPTLSKRAADLFEDAQMRGVKRTDNMMTVERMSEVLRNTLMKPVLEMQDARYQWIKDHYGTWGAISPFKGGNAHRLEFDKLVMDVFNHESKQATTIDIDEALVDKNVRKAVDALKRLYKDRIDLGQKSSSMFGGKADRNLIDADWYSVDDEFHRLVDTDMYRTFVSYFADKGDEGAKEFLTKYANVASSTPKAVELIKETIIRQRKMEAMKKYNKDLEKATTNGTEPPKTPIVNSNVTDDEVKAFRDEKVKGWVNQVMRPLEDNIDGLDANGKEAALGSLNFFKGRLPMDTGTIMPIVDSDGNIVHEFSFDKDLRYYDVDHILQRSINRFSGEAAMRTHFGNATEYQKFVKQVNHELELASLGNKGRISTSEAQNRKLWFKDEMARLRGMRGDYERNIYGEAQAVTKIMNNLAYFKRGGSMGYNQAGDLGGAIAYGGLKQVFGLFNPLRRLVDNIRYGKGVAKDLDDLQWHIFGNTMENRIWQGNWGDQQTRAALSQRGFGLQNALVEAADFTHNITKFTSQINMLGHMTDSMIRAARSAGITDSIRWAYGKEFNALRNPFSDANFKALGRSKNINALRTELRADIKKYMPWSNEKGTIADINKADVDTWMREKPNTYWLWYDLIQNQANKSVLLATAEGNRNLLKEHNALMRMVGMFKDFSFRSNNAQFMRAVQQRELQDAIAFGLSLATNTAAFAARNGIKMMALYALGQTDAAKEVRDNYLNDKALAKAAFFRTGFLSPLGMANDVWETASGTPTIRTTVNRYQSRPPTDIGGYIGNYIAQTPSLDTAADYTYKPVQAAWRIANKEGTQKDFKTLMNLLPIPDFIPYTQAIDKLATLSGLPIQKPKTKK